MATFSVSIPDADVGRVTKALCSLEDTTITVSNATSALEDLVVRITRDYEARQRALRVPSIPPDPQISVTVVTPPPV